MSTPAAPFLGLRLIVSGSQVAVQPLDTTAPTVATLSIDLAAGSAQVLPSAPQHGAAMDILAVMGLCKLHTGTALLVITGARKVACIDGADIYEVAEAKVVAAPSAKSSRANRALLDLLEQAVDPAGAGRGLHFSYGYDLTLTAQRALGLRVADPDGFRAQLPVQRADARFFWNRAIAAPLLAAGAARFVQPCILGFVQQLPHLQFRDQAQGGSPVTASITLLARRGVARSGTRQWRRGADAEGNVANFAETEQLLSIEGPSSSPLAGTLCSYLVLRGSIPLLWTQLPNIKYKPTTLIAPADLSGPVHDKHFHALVEQYKGVVAVNLINHHGTEGKLEAAFRSEAARLASSASAAGKAVRYVAFDFHAECGGKRYHRLSLLWDQIAGSVAAQGFLTAQPGTCTSSTQQAGVVRVNCIDCLDRTNVVQGVLARKALEAMLSSLGLLPPGMGGGPATLPQAYPEVEKEFKILWADHGDALSTQYAGTGAMKSGFTRTGKRTTAGAIDDGVKAVVRYYLNNYQDGRKQDAIDLLTGAYEPDGVRPPPIKPQPSPVLPLLLSFMGMGVAMHNLAQLARYGAAAAAATTMAASSGDASAQPAGLAQVAATAKQLLGTVLLGAPGLGRQLLGVEDPETVGGVTRNVTAASVMESAVAVAPNAVMLGLTHVLLPLLLGAGLLALIVQNGKHLVNKPQLCPQLAVTVEKPAKKKA